jgi:hypothetical protein
VAGAINNLKWPKTFGGIPLLYGMRTYNPQQQDVHAIRVPSRVRSAEYEVRKAERATQEEFEKVQQNLIKRLQQHQLTPPKASLRESQLMARSADETREKNIFVDAVRGINALNSLIDNAQTIRQLQNLNSKSLPDLEGNLASLHISRDRPEVQGVINAKNAIKTRIEKRLSDYIKDKSSNNGILNCQKSITESYIVSLVDQLLHKNITINDLASQSLRSLDKLSPDHRFENYWNNGYRCRAVLFWSMLDTQDKNYEALQRDFSGYFAFNGDADVILKLMTNILDDDSKKHIKQLISDWRVMSNNKIPDVYKPLYKDKKTVQKAKQQYQYAIEKMGTVLKNK